MTDNLVERALRGEGPLFEAMLADRARELAAPAAAPESPDMLAFLLMAGRAGRWALPLVEAARVEPLAQCMPMPHQHAAVLGLALLAGRRCLVVDVDAALAGISRRPGGRLGHAVLLRRHGVALAVERAEAIRRLAPAAAGRRVLAEGSMLVEADALVAALGRGGSS